MGRGHGKLLLLMPSLPLEVRQQVLGNIAAAFGSMSLVVARRMNILPRLRSAGDTPSTRRARTRRTSTRISGALACRRYQDRS